MNYQLTLLNEENKNTILRLYSNQREIYSDPFLQRKYC